MKKDNLLLPILIGIISILLLIVINTYLIINTKNDIKELEKYLIIAEQGTIEEAKPVKKAIIKQNFTLMKDEGHDVGSAGIAYEITKRDPHPYAELIASFTEHELAVFYTVLCAEAGGESIEGQRAAAEVMLNRVLSNKYPDTIIEVLSQPSQFSVWDTINVGTYNNTQVEVIELVSIEDPILPCLYYVYFSQGIARYMDKEINKPIQIGNHWFGARQD